VQPLPERPTHTQAEVHFRNVLDEEGFAQPDEVRHWCDPDEVVFMWREPRVAIVIELDADGGVDIRPGSAAHDPPV
jgi:hypothetical protein